jgi:CheY-like chemotaxis protein
MEPPRLFEKSILLVDDDDGAREALKLLLRIDRHKVKEARNGTEALQILAVEQFDLVILDYFMPDIRGSELAVTIKALLPGLPIVMVTAYIEKIPECDRPVEAVLGKPAGIHDLRQAISRVLESNVQK